MEGAQWGIDRLSRHVKNLQCDVSKLVGISKQRRGEGSTLVPRGAGFPLSLKRTVGRDRSLAVGRKLSWRSRILHQSVQFTTNASAFGCDLFACFFSEHDHKSNEFERTEQAVVILPVDDDIII